MKDWKIKCLSGIGLNFCKWCSRRKEKNKLLLKTEENSNKSFINYKHVK